MLYGSEIWSWKKHPEVEKLKLKYFKSSFSQDSNISSYILMEETKGKDQWIDAGKRVIRFEKK